MNVISRCTGIVALALAASQPGHALAQTRGIGTAAVDPMTLVDPDLRAALGRSLPEFDDAMLQRMRRPMPAAPRPVPAGAELRTMGGKPGQPPVTVYVMAPPSTNRRRPAILHMHGGGYIIGGAAGGVASLRRLAEKHDWVVVSVEYRLAPETRYPGSLEDNYAALKWLHDNAAELGVDPARLALLGESAGGGHAAALALAARDRKEVPVAFQALIYPMLDDRTGNARKVPPHIGTFIWTRRSNAFGWTALLGVPAGSAKVPSGAVPARVADLKGLPPTWIGVGALDLFAQEDMEYARRLVESGVPTEFHLVPGAYHGFDLFSPKAPVVQRFAASWEDALVRALGGKATADR